MANSIEILSRFGFPPGVLNALRKDGIRELLDHQVEAVTRFDLLGQEDLLVSLPTSCGKTLIGELAGVGAALLGRRAVFSVPLKAIAREKYETFQRRYADYGLRVRLATGEFSEHLDDLANGAFDIAVMIHEKLIHTLVRNPDFLQKIDVAILDELQSVEEASRGPNLEFLLVLLRESEPRVRRVGLAGVLASDDPLVEDFGGRWLTTSRRPVDLREGIVLLDPDLAAKAAASYGLEAPPPEDGNAVCVYRSYNTGLADVESLPMARAGEGEGWDLVNLALGLAERDESALVFLPSRREAETMARVLAEARPVERRIEAHEVDDEDLQRCLERGVAYHHSDCSPRRRTFVEEAFRDGRIQLLCCTSTLAMGVNLPARNVLIHPFVWNGRGGASELSLLEESVFRNMAGRAGRLGLEETFGRSLILASSEREWDLYRTRYWEGTVSRLQPCWLDREIGPSLLAAVAAGHDTTGALEGLVANTLSSRRNPTLKLKRHERVAEELRRAINLRLVEARPRPGSSAESLELTRLGKVVALRGVSFETGRDLAAWVDRLEGKTPDPLAALVRVLSLVEAKDWNWPREAQPDSRGHWAREVRERLGWEDLESLGPEWSGKDALSERFEDAARMALGLIRWAEGEPFESIRAEVPMASLGRLHSAGEGARWLLETAADVRSIRGGDEESAERLRALAISAGIGLPEWAIAWRTVPSELLDREEKIVLAGEMDSPARLLETEIDTSLDRGGVRISRDRLERVREFLKHATSALAEKKKRLRSKSGPPEEGRKRPKKRIAVLLDANLVEMGGQFRAFAENRRVLLGMRTAELLLRLVRGRRDNGEEGWTAKQDLGVEPENLSQRISDLRRRLGSPPGDERSWIESDRNGHYRLTCEANRIRWEPKETPAEIRALLS